MLFWALNYGTNISKLTGANLNKSCCVIHLNNFVSEMETLTNAYAVRSAAKITVRFIACLDSNF